jgi:hypothetical protein
VQEPGVSLAEACPIGLEPYWRHGRIAEARVVVEDRGLASLDIVAAGLEAVVVALLLDGLEINGGWGRRVDRLGMRASGEQNGGEYGSDAKGFLHGEGLVGQERAAGGCVLMV